MKKTVPRMQQLDSPYIIPNISPVPMNCLHLVKEDDILYLVPGDGCCGPNCAAAFLFQDEVFGPKLRIRMNSFQAEHWDRRYQYISQCSKGHPFERNLKGGNVSFPDPLKLFKFFEYSKKEAYMWSDSKDLATIADMYQLKF